MRKFGLGFALGLLVAASPVMAEVEISRDNQVWIKGWPVWRGDEVVCHGVLISFNTAQIICIDGS